MDLTRSHRCERQQVDTTPSGLIRQRPHVHIRAQVVALIVCVAPGIADCAISQPVPSRVRWHIASTLIAADPGVFREVEPTVVPVVEQVIEEPVGQLPTLDLVA